MPVALMRLSISLAILLACTLVSPAAAQGAADDSVATALRRDGTRHAAAHAVVWIERGALTDEEGTRFAEVMNRAVAEISRMIGRPLDREHYDEDTVQVFVSTAVGVSHVYGGYAHQQFRKPYLYLDPAKIRSGDAPFVHEATHLVAWRFGSHSLREGFATWVESTLIARGVVEAKGLFGMSSPGAADERARTLLTQESGGLVLSSVGAVGAPDAGITSPERPRVRSAYYVLSQSFAQHLVRALGVEATLRLYESTAADAYQRQTGKSLDEWRRAWRQSLAGEAAASTP